MGTRIDKGVGRGVSQGKWEWENVHFSNKVRMLKERNARMKDDHAAAFKKRKWSAVARGGGINMEAAKVRNEERTKEIKKGEGRLEHRNKKNKERDLSVVGKVTVTPLLHYVS